MNALQECYEAISNAVGTPAESFEVAQAVEEVRRYWRPRTVRVLLLAESHVFTSEDELAVRINPQTLGLPLSYPSQFVRFVYCLGYGEKEILSRSVIGNRGTPQFWKTLYACQGDTSDQGFQKLLRSSRMSFQERIAAKVALLERLRDTGVWLVDASITALYQPRGQRTDRRAVVKTLTTCWDTYIRQVVAEASPKHIIVIGKGVACTLESRLRRVSATITVLPQPQAHLSAAEHASIHKMYFDICKEACVV